MKTKFIFESNRLQLTFIRCSPDISPGFANIFRLDPRKEFEILSQKNSGGIILEKGFFWVCEMSL